MPIPGNGFYIAYALSRYCNRHIHGADLLCSSKYYYFNIKGYQKLKMKEDVLHAIADQTQKAIVTLIFLQAIIPNAMAEKFDMSRQAVSKHIKVLQECKLIKPEQHGREIHYHFNPKKMQELDKWLAQFRKTWETQFDQLDNVLSTMKKQKK